MIGHMLGFRLPDTYVFWILGIDLDTSTINYYTQMLHVWNIFLHLPQNQRNVGKYSIHGASGL